MATNIAASPAPALPNATGRRGRSRLVLIVVGVIVLVAFTYLLAWLDASRLTATYLEDAAQSYAAGNYLAALQGYTEWDEEARAYVTRGGYIHVERIWQNRYAWPVPDSVAGARARIAEIIDERMTIAEAERFIQENSGRANRYMGPIFLRLGELYEAEGDLRSARDIYEEVPDLFRGEPALIERAQAHLARLAAQEEEED